MKAVVLTGIRQVEVRDIPQPKIEKDTDVLLKTEWVGVCGSDVHYYETGRIGEQVVTNALQRLQRLEEKLIVSKLVIRLSLILPSPAISATSAKQEEKIHASTCGFSAHLVRAMVASANILLCPKKTVILQKVKSRLSKACCVNPCR
jgi:hypothetical protein